MRQDSSLETTIALPVPQIRIFCESGLVSELLIAGRDTFNQEQNVLVFLTVYTCRDHS